MMSALPVLLCGRSEQIARSVIAALKPEYEGSSASVTRNTFPASMTDVR